MAALVSAIATLLLIFYGLDRKRYEVVIATLHARRQAAAEPPS